METVFRFFRNLFRRDAWMKSPEESDIPTYTFYDTIEEFGYHFNEKGELVDENGGPFNFFVKEDRNYNQQHYDALGELITEYLYTKMETDLGLQKVFCPLDAKKEEAQGFIFQSSDAAQCETLMVIINGAGVVRAGQWSRKLIINEGIDVGSQFPYIRRAQAAGYGVIVLNTNQNTQVINGKAMEIRGSSTAEDHGLYMWEHIISKTSAANIVIVAHSYGGLVTCTMAERFLEDFKKRVFCIVFTDSIHTVDRQQWSQPVKEFLKERAVNFASTYVPLDYMMQASSPDDCLSVSAGTEEHERTSPACIDSAFKFIHDNHASWTTNGSMAPRHFKPLPDDLSEFSCANRWARMKEKIEDGASSSMADEAAPEMQGSEEGASSNMADKSEPEMKSSREAATSNMADKPAPEAKKRSTVDEEEDSLSKNGKGQEEENVISQRDGEELEVPGDGQEKTVVTTEKAEVKVEDEGNDQGSAMTSTSDTDDAHVDQGKEEEEVQVEKIVDSKKTEETEKTEEAESEPEARERGTGEPGTDSKDEMGGEAAREEVATEDREKEHISHMDSKSQQEEVSTDAASGGHGQRE